MRLIPRRLLRTFMLAVALPFACALPSAQAQNIDDLVVQAREALRKKDRNMLAAARIGVNTARHPLAQWVEYWELTSRLNEAQQPELDSFYARWPGSYVEDRLRNDWLLELGRRRDWAHFRTEFPRFRMNDDREVTCYALLTQHLNGQQVRDAARAAWTAQRDLDDGCALLARTLADARVFTPDDAWYAARLAVEANRPRTARAALALIGPGVDKAGGDALDNPAAFIARRPSLPAAQGHELLLLALMRLAATDPEAAAAQLDGASSRRLPQVLAATAWAHIARQAALRQMPQAGDWARRAWQDWDAASKPGMQPPWSDEVLAWHVRAALREADAPTARAGPRWRLMARAIDAMSPAEQRDGAWVYWRSRALLAGLPAGVDSEPGRAAARQALESIAPQLGFYGKLATEELGGRLVLPAAPAPLTPAEREAARGHPGLTRALQLIQIGLRSEGVREWNYSLRGMPERELLAAAQLACEREVWDRCINTSDRTRGEIDIAQRYPTPYRAQVMAAARNAGLDPALMFGLIRQESRFMPELRSAVGAAGLMQLMPATARLTAKQIGLDFRPEMIADRDVNLQIGAAYLRRVVDDFGGSLAMATAAYNAGPGRPRRWREGGATMEPAAWAESIPFNETRDYVKKVLSNSVVYAALLAAPAGLSSGNGATGAPLPTLKSRLGPPIGPAAASVLGRRDSAPAVPDRELQ